MSEYFFEDIYPGLNAKIKLYSKTDEYICKIDIEVNDIKKNTSYFFVLIQNNTNIELIDNNGNHICSLDTLVINDSKSLEQIAKIVITTCIYTFNIININHETETISNEEPLIRPCYIHYFQNEMYPTGFTGYSPSQIQSAYNVNPRLSSLINKPIITIVIAYSYPDLQNDFNTFCKLFNLPPSKLKIATLDRLKTQDPGWAAEECLDVQWAYAMNPNAIIQVVEAISNSYEDMFSAVRYASNPPPGSNLLKPHIISMSWGAPEFSSQLNYEKYFSDKSICYIAATGDNNFGCYPSTSPRVLAVGGTSLSLNYNNKRLKETTWTSAGCGISSVFLKPSYQKDIKPINKYSKRVIPDISGVASASTGVSVVYKQKQIIVGGTSVSTPIMAGILSIPFSKRQELKKSSFTTINNLSNNLQSVLYSLYKNNTIYNKNFYDIKIGYDGNFTASEGIDVATGLGVMNGVEITKSLINV